MGIVGCVCYTLWWVYYYYSDVGFLDYNEDNFRFSMVAYKHTTRIHFFTFPPSHFWYLEKMKMKGKKIKPVGKK